MKSTMPDRSLEVMQFAPNVVRSGNTKDHDNPSEHDGMGIAEARNLTTK